MKSSQRIGLGFGLFAVIRRQINIIACNPLILPNSHDIAGCILKVESDREKAGEESLENYFVRSHDELLHYSKKTIASRYFFPGSKFFIGYAQQTALYKSEENEGKFNTHGGHAFAGITDEKFQFIPGTVISKVTDGFPQEARDTVFTDFGTNESITLTKQEYTVPAKFETPEQVDRWIYGEQGKFSAKSKGSGIYIAILPLSLTNIAIDKVQLRVAEELQNLSYSRLTAACGQAMVRAYTEIVESLESLTPQDSLDIVLRNIVKKNITDLVMTLIKDSGIKRSPLTIFNMQQNNREGFDNNDFITKKR